MTSARDGAKNENDFHFHRCGSLTFWQRPGGRCIIGKKNMEQKTKYRTRHSEELIAYLQSIPGRHFTVSDVGDYFKGRGTPMGTTTIYRHLDRLVDEGLVNKYIIDATSPACFEYVGDAHTDTETVCFHCKCEQCGKLIHLHCFELEGIRAHLMAEHHFALNPLRTVFYGLCSECMEKGEAR